MLTVWRPVAPSGAGPWELSSWGVPVASMARTWRTWLPRGASQVQYHWRQVSIEPLAARVARCQGPPSTRTSTAEMPTCWCQATPATTTGPAFALDCGRSMRDWVLIGPSSDQPRGVQYASNRSNRLTSSDITHLVAET